jgi:hypothetical protein
MLKLDFLDFKIIIRYLLVISTILMAGKYLKDAIAILFIFTILYFLITKNVYKTIEIFLIWFFISGFFIGQGYITMGYVSKYIAKPSFLLFVIFIYFFFQIPSKLVHSGFVGVWILYLFIALLSVVKQGQSPFVIITASSFFMMFLLLQAADISGEQYNKLLNLFIAVAILQTAVSYLQVSQIIAPPSKIMEDGAGGTFQWEAGLDDVASGTFGAGLSFNTSWYATLISLFMLLMWGLTKNSKYLIVLPLVFLQFATVDSKTIMGVTALMLTYTLYYLFKKSSIFNISVGKFLFFITFLLIGVFGFIKAWNTYYVYYGKETGGNRTDIGAVYNNEAKSSLNLILENIGDWGKIRGFQYIFNDFVNNEPTQLIWGYGIQGYTINGKRRYIERQDAPIMQLNNLTSSRSGLITLFATNGLLGFILFIMAVSFWYRGIKCRETNQYEHILSGMLKIYLPFSILAAFVYTVALTSIPLITFAAIISIYMRISDDYNNSALLHFPKTEKYIRFTQMPMVNRTDFSDFSLSERLTKK